MSPIGVVILDLDGCVFAAFDTYVTRWTRVAATSETFVWTGQEDPAILQGITHHWFQLAELLAQQALVPGQAEMPLAGEPFHDALVSAILVALAVHGDGEFEARAIAWQRSWPGFQGRAEAAPVPAG